MTFFLRQLRTFLVGTIVALCLVPGFVWRLSYVAPSVGFIQNGLGNDPDIALVHGRFVAEPCETCRQTSAVFYLGTIVGSPATWSITQLQSLNARNQPLPYIPRHLGIVALFSALPALALLAALTLRAIRTRPFLRARARATALTRWALTLAAMGTLPIFVVSMEYSIHLTLESRMNPLSTIDWRCSVSAGATTFSRRQTPSTDPLAIFGSVTITPRRSFEEIVWLPSGQSVVAWPLPTGILTLPLWMSFLLTALPATLLWRSAYRHHRRTLTNACPHCNYSLTGLSPNSPCPECGAQPAKPAFASPR